MERAQGDAEGCWDWLHLGERHDCCPPAACARVEPLLSALVDGELTLAERERVEGHLGGCPDCRRTLVVFRAFGAGLAAALPAKAPWPVCARPPH